LLFGLLANAVALRLHHVTTKEKPGDEDMICMDGSKDMCIDKDSPDVYEEASEQKPLELIAEDATLPELPSDRRTLLIGAVHAFHGSTALEEILMSSPQVATLCTANGYQCEGAYILSPHAEVRPHMMDWSVTLAAFSEHWDLKKHFLFEKDPWLPGANVPTVGVDDPKLAHEQIRKAVAGPLPQKFEEEGIKHLDVEYLMMWRPVCMAKLSSHYADTIEDEEVELSNLEQMVEFHKYLTSKKETVHVMSFADLVWLPKRTASRLQKDLPRLGKLNEEYVPEMGKDIHPGNLWKAEGSVAEFGRKIDPESVQYSVKDHSCTEGASGFVLLPAEYGPRIAAATEYLKVLSQ